MAHSVRRSLRYVRDESEDFKPVATCDCNQCDAACIATRTVSAIKKLEHAKEVLSVTAQRLGVCCFGRPILLNHADRA